MEIKGSRYQKPKLNRSMEVDVPGNEAPYLITVGPEL